MNTVWPWTRACLTSLRPIGTALLFNRVLCVDWKRGASPYWLPQFSWKSEQHHLPPSHTALATTPRRQLPGNQTMLEPLAVVCMWESLCFACMHLRSGIVRQQQRKHLSFNKTVKPCVNIENITHLIAGSRRTPQLSVFFKQIAILWWKYKEIIMD